MLRHASPFFEAAATPGASAATPPPLAVVRRVANVPTLRLSLLEGFLRGPSLTYAHPFLRPSCTGADHWTKTSCGLRGRSKNAQKGGALSPTRVDSTKGMQNAAASSQQQQLLDEHHREQELRHERSSHDYTQDAHAEQPLEQTQPPLYSQQGVVQPGGGSAKNPLVLQLAFELLQRHRQQQQTGGSSRAPVERLPRLAQGQSERSSGSLPNSHREASSHQGIPFEIHRLAVGSSLPVWQRPAQVAVEQRSLQKIAACCREAFQQCPLQTPILQKTPAALLQQSIAQASKQQHVLPSSQEQEASLVASSPELPLRLPPPTVCPPLQPQHYPQQQQVQLGGMRTRRLERLNVEYLGSSNNSSTGRRREGLNVHVFPGTYVDAKGQRHRVVVKQLPLQPAAPNTPLWEQQQQLLQLLLQWQQRKCCGVIDIKGFEVHRDGVAACWSAPGAGSLQRVSQGEEGLLPLAEISNSRSTVIRSSNSSAAFLRMPQDVAAASMQSTQSTPAEAAGRRDVYVVLQAAAGPLHKHVNLEQLKRQASNNSFLPPQGGHTCAQQQSLRKRGADVMSLLHLHSLKAGCGAHLCIHPNNLLLLLPSFDVFIGDNLGSMRLLSLLAEIRTGALTNLVKAQLSLKLFLDDTTRLLWVSPSLIARLKKLQKHLNSLMAFHAEHQYLLHPEHPPKKHPQVDVFRIIADRSTTSETPAETPPIVAATSAAVLAIQSQRKATPAAEADAAALHAALEQRFAALYKLAELPPAIQQTADCWSLGACLFSIVTGGLHPYGSTENPKETLENMEKGDMVNMNLLDNSPLLQDLLRLLLQQKQEPEQSVLRLAVCHPVFWASSDLLLFLRAFRLMLLQQQKQQRPGETRRQKISSLTGEAAWKDACIHDMSNSSSRPEDLQSGGLGDSDNPLSNEATDADASTANKDQLYAAALAKLSATPLPQDVLASIRQEPHLCRTGQDLYPHHKALFVERHSSLPAAETVEVAGSAATCADEVPPNKAVHVTPDSGTPMADLPYKDYEAVETTAGTPHFPEKPLETAETHPSKAALQEAAAAPPMKAAPATANGATAAPLATTTTVEDFLSVLDFLNLLATFADNTSVASWQTDAHMQLSQREHATVEPVIKEAFAETDFAAAASSEGAPECKTQLLRIQQQIDSRVHSHIRIPMAALPPSCVSLQQHALSRQEGVASQWIAQQQVLLQQKPLQQMHGREALAERLQRLVGKTAPNGRSVLQQLQHLLLESSMKELRPPAPREESAAAVNETAAGVTTPAPLAEPAALQTHTTLGQSLHATPRASLECKSSLESRYERLAVHEKLPAAATREVASAVQTHRPTAAAAEKSATQPPVQAEKILDGIRILQKQNAGREMPKPQEEKKQFGDVYTLQRLLAARLSSLRQPFPGSLSPLFSQSTLVVIGNGDRSSAANGRREEEHLASLHQSRRQQWPLSQLLEGSRMCFSMRITEHLSRLLRDLVAAKGMQLKDLPVQLSAHERQKQCEKPQPQHQGTGWTSEERETVLMAQKQVLQLLWQDATLLRATNAEKELCGSRKLQVSAAHDAKTETFTEYEQAQQQQLLALLREQRLQQQRQPSTLVKPCTSVFAGEFSCVAELRLRQLLRQETSAAPSGESSPLPASWHFRWHADATDTAFAAWLEYMLQQSLRWHQQAQSLEQHRSQQLHPHQQSQQQTEKQRSHLEQQQRMQLHQQPLQHSTTRPLVGGSGVSDIPSHERLSPGRTAVDGSSDGMLRRHPVHLVHQLLHRQQEQLAPRNCAPLGPNLRHLIVSASDLQAQQAKRMNVLPSDKELDQTQQVQQASQQKAAPNNRREPLKDQEQQSVHQLPSHVQVTHQQKEPHAAVSMPATEQIQPLEAVARRLVRVASVPAGEGLAAADAPQVPRPALASSVQEMTTPKRVQYHQPQQAEWSVSASRSRRGGGVKQLGGTKVSKNQQRHPRFKTAAAK
ncbi:hypothetical protein cyc_00541 [Cyclospora cayetanensis]|uniref:Protein kinase domain-containing protein n=1 Tax=Cyclospora cayetanensis TaxID=88456 RepID=A0A1D3D3T4_9EIME|nr:hypothetical protein cyc_00541 [Cyclospora cayetanensis]